VYWIRQYIYFHQKRHPNDLNASHVEKYLSHLAVNRHVSASTQTQALNALAFLYKTVLERPFGALSGFKRVQRKYRIPVVLSVNEVARTLSLMKGTPQLMAELIYGAGLRVHECVTLRVKDIDFEASSISVRSGKGGKDRTTVLPNRLRSPLRQHVLRVAALHKSDVLRGEGCAPMPEALFRKYPRASRSLAWQFVFPS
jgi:site-specific recombinase XerD